MGIRDVQLRAGQLIVTPDEGGARAYDIVNYLRAADIPDLTISSLTLLKELAEVILVLLHTLHEQGVIGEELVGTDLQFLHDRLVDDMTADTDILEGE